MEATRGLSVKLNNYFGVQHVLCFMKQGEPWLNFPYFVAVLFILLLGFFV
jgi:hypothetical protein